MTSRRLASVTAVLAATLLAGCATYPYDDGYYDGSGYYGGGYGAVVPYRVYGPYPYDYRYGDHRYGGHDQHRHDYRHDRRYDRHDDGRYDGDRRDRHYRDGDRTRDWRAGDDERRRRMRGDDGASPEERYRRDRQARIDEAQRDAADTAVRRRDADRRRGAGAATIPGAPVYLEGRDARADRRQERSSDAERQAQRRAAEVRADRREDRRAATEAAAERERTERQAERDGAPLLELPPNGSAQRQR